MVIVNFLARDKRLFCQKENGRKTLRNEYRKKGKKYSLELEIFPLLLHGRTTLLLNMRFGAVSLAYSVSSSTVPLGDLKREARANLFHNDLCKIYQACRWVSLEKWHLRQRIHLRQCIQLCHHRVMDAVERFAKHSSS